MTEFEWIARHFAPLAAGHDGAYGLRDDAAALHIPAGHELIITTDALVESVHFLPHTSPALLARKALAVNLSDLAAKGAVPLAYSLALCLPAATDEAWIESFTDGLGQMQQAFGLHLIGGDTTRSHTLTLAITAYGLCPAGAMIRRNGAQISDGVYVTGTLGDAAFGLRLAQAGEHAHPLAQRYHLPTPRTATGLALRGLATACMDLSDGLLQDAAHLATASGVRLELEEPLLPLSAALREACAASGQPVRDYYSGGDDYELLFTLPPEKIDALGAHAPITRIGTVVQGSGVALRDEMGATITLTQSGWQHF